MDDLGVTPMTVRAWHSALESAMGSSGGGVVEPGRGPKSSITAEQVAQIVELNIKTTPGSDALVVPEYD